jgi:Trk K+ transport system NAD-binding subunit
LRAILVGAGGVGRAVLERLGEHWSVTAIDFDAGRLEALSAQRQIECIQGDGSSRVTLERAGLAQADALVVAVRDDDVSLEVSRLAHQAGVGRVAAMVVSPTRLAEFTRLGVIAVSPDRLAAREVELVLEPRRVTSAAFADGRAEAIEFRLAPDSSLVGRLLADLSLSGWLVVAVLRDGELIVPHGRTKLAAGDRVTVVGPAADHAAMVRVFTEGEARFPLAYGRRVGVALSSGTAVIAEAQAFARLTAAEGLVVIHPNPAKLDDAAAGQLRERLQALGASGPSIEFSAAANETAGLADLIALREREQLGCLVVPRPSSLRSAVGLLGRLVPTGLPCLLAAGVPRYERVVIPARDSQGAWEAAWVALDLAAHNALPVEALGASTPRFLASEDDEATLREAAMRLRDEGSVRTVEVAGRIVRANPVRVFRAVPVSDLLVLSHSGRAGNLLRPGFTAAVAAGLKGSLLVVPPDPRRK